MGIESKHRSEALIQYRSPRSITLKWDNIMDKQTEVVVVSKKVEGLKAKIEAMLAESGSHYRRMLVKSSQKKTFKCSADCFGVKFYSFDESFECHTRCQKPLNSLSDFQQILVSQFDVSPT